MFQKHMLMMLMATAVTTAMAFTQQEDSPKQDPQEKAKTIKAISEDGKLFIIDEEGNKQELDISGAKSIMIRQSKNLINENGDTQSNAVGRAVIIGEDGEQTVIELDGANNIELPGLNMKFREFERVIPEIRMPDLPGELRADFNFAGPQVFRMNSLQAGKYMIGVHCTPVDEALRSHLQLDNGVGLIVRNVTEGSPANGADLQEHDILIYADDTELGSVGDLTAVVETAGEEEREINLTIVRQGNETSAKVSPQKRPENQFPTVQGFNAGPVNGRFHFEQMGPGIIVENSERMEDVVEQLREQMEQMQEDMKQMIERDK